VILDNLGENVGVARVAAVASSTTLRFTFDPAPTIATVLPAGTQAISGSVVFATSDAVTVGVGVTQVDVLAVCTQAGEIGNGFAAGQVKTLGDAPDGLTVSAVENTTTSEGGAEAESDDRLRERIVLAPETFSVAGSVESYRFWAMSAHPDIIDVAVISHIPGDVTLYPLTAAGLPGETIKALVLATCSGEKVRPLNDAVLVADPVPVDYAIDVQIVLHATADAQLAQAELEKAAQAFRDARLQFGQSIVRSQLIDALFVYGVYSVTPVTPAADLNLEKWEWARCTSINVTITGVAND
jgi:phage-related baseplate assembly protein